MAARISKMQKAEIKPEKDPLWFKNRKEPKPNSMRKSDTWDHIQGTRFYLWLWVSLIQSLLYVPCNSEENILHIHVCFGTLHSWSDQPKQKLDKWLSTTLRSMLAVRSGRLYTDLSWKIHEGILEKLACTILSIRGFRAQLQSNSDNPKSAPNNNRTLCLAWLFKKQTSDKMQKLASSHFKLTCHLARRTDLDFWEYPPNFMQCKVSANMKLDESLTVSKNLMPNSSARAWPFAVGTACKCKTALSRSNSISKTF